MIALVSIAFSPVKESDNACMALPKDFACSPKLSRPVLKPSLLAIPSRMFDVDKLKIAPAASANTSTPVFTELSIPENALRNSAIFLPTSGKSFVAPTAIPSSTPPTRLPTNSPIPVPILTRIFIPPSRNSSTPGIRSITPATATITAPKAVIIPINAAMYNEALGGIGGILLAINDAAHIAFNIIDKAITLGILADTSSLSIMPSMTATPVNTANITPTAARALLSTLSILPNTAVAAAKPSIITDRAVALDADALKLYLLIIKSNPPSAATITVMVNMVFMDVVATEEAFSTTANIPIMVDMANVALTSFSVFTKESATTDAAITPIAIAIPVRLLPTSFAPRN